MPPRRGLWLGGIRLLQIGRSYGAAASLFRSAGRRAASASRPCYPFSGHALNFLDGTDPFTLEITLSRFAEDWLGDKSVLQPQRFFHCRAKVLLRLTQTSHQSDINAKLIRGQYLPAEFAESKAAP